jgi:hypothetical protein
MATFPLSARLGFLTAAWLTLTTLARSLGAVAVFPQVQGVNADLAATIRLLWSCVSVDFGPTSLVAWRLRKRSTPRDAAPHRAGTLPASLRHRSVLTVCVSEEKTRTPVSRR